MIILLMTLFSLSAVYFTRLLAKKNMKAAAISVAALYIYIIVWTYAVFIFDIANLGFSDSETQISLLTGSDIYHSFVSITGKMSVIPLPMLKAVVVVAVMTLLAGFMVAFHGIIEISREIYAFANKSFHSFSARPEWSEKTVKQDVTKSSIIRMHCRANC